jgi:hypothetical protein
MISVIDVELLQGGSKAANKTRDNALEVFCLIAHRERTQWWAQRNKSKQVMLWELSSGKVDRVENTTALGKTGKDAG